MLYSQCSERQLRTKIMPILAKNKDLNFSFKVLDEFEAGLVLSGQEVRAAKKGLLSLQGAFVSIKNGQAWLKNLHISPYDKASHDLKNYNPNRDRQLLLHQKEIQYLGGKTQAEGLTIMPISLYTTRRLVKVKVALVKGKKKFDKRADIKKREIDRRIASKLKSVFR